MAIIGLLFLILEIFTPAMFFLNLAFAAFLTAGFAFFITNSASLLNLFPFCKPIISVPWEVTTTGILYLQAIADIIQIWPACIISGLKLSIVVDSSVVLSGSKLSIVLILLIYFQ